MQAQPTTTELIVVLYKPPFDCRNVLRAFAESSYFNHTGANNYLFLLRGLTIHQSIVINTICFNDLLNVSVAVPPPRMGHRESWLLIEQSAAHLTIESAAGSPGVRILLRWLRP